MKIHKHSIIGNKMEEKIYDVIIIGSGPAAYNCALYSSRAQRNPLLFKGNPLSSLPQGGQLTITTDVENFLGFDQPISGKELTDKFEKHALKFGTNMLDRSIIKVDLSSKPFKIEDDEGEFYLTKTLVIATGAKAKTLQIPSETKFWHHGISACAVCDGALPIFRNKIITIIGGGDTAMEEALFLTKYAKQVILIHRSSKFRASKIMIERVLQNQKITIKYDTVVLDGYSSSKNLEYIMVENTITKEKEKIETSGLFYAIGHQPNSSFLNGQVDIDENGYIKTKPGTTITSIPGVFACGDVQDKIYRQAITAAASGCMAALDIEMFLN